MNYHILNPEVAGAFGPHTTMNSTVHPPSVKHLHFELDAWLGDDLIQSFPCYLVTTTLKSKLEAMRPSGISFAAAEVSVSADFAELQPGVKVPVLVWIKIQGVPGNDDFGLTKDARLVVSNQVLEEMQKGQLKHCDVEDFTG